MEVEKPGRKGLREIAALADVVFNTVNRLIATPGTSSFQHGLNILKTLQVSR